MKNWLIFKPFVDLYHSLFTNDMGMSQRKVLGYLGVMYVAAKISFSVEDEKIRYNLVVAWLVFGSVCLGLVTASEIIKLVNREKPEDAK